MLAIATGLVMMIKPAANPANPAQSTILDKDATPAAEPAPTTLAAPVEEGTDAEGIPTEAAAAATTAEPATEPVAQTPKRGRVSVAVFPWGDVWIDGKPQGKAPIRGVALPPGRHKVSAGQGEPSKTRVVRIKEGQRLKLQFDLSE